MEKIRAKLFLAHHFPQVPICCRHNASLDRHLAILSYAQDAVLL
jgi:hypothetical protein